MRRSTVLYLGFALLAACHREPVTMVPVPDATRRVSATRSEPDWVTRLGDRVVCLIRSGLGTECQAGQPNVRVCDSRTAAEVRRTIQPILDSIPQVELVPFAVNRDLARLFPDAVPTSDVWDARRAAPCADWGDGNRCAAIRYQGLGFVFRGEGGSSNLTAVEAFLIEPGCRESAPVEG